MWSSRLFWRLSLTYAGLNIAWALVFVIIVSRWHERQVIEQVDHRLRDIALLVEHTVRGQLSAGQTPELQAQVRDLGAQIGIRITLVAMDGVVLADSEQKSIAAVNQMENHSDRIELARAVEYGSGRSERESPTLGVPMAYFAIRSDRDDVPVGLVRVAIPIASILRDMAEIRRLIWLLALLVSVTVLIITYWIAIRIIRPLTRLTSAADAIATGDYSPRVRLSQRDELSQLADAFNRMSRQLGTQVGQLRTSSERLATVLGGMDEGVIAVDDELRILFANSAAARILEFASDRAEGRRLLETVRHHALYDVVSSTLTSGSPQQSEMEWGGTNQQILSVNSTPLPGEPCPGVVLVLRDITELRRLESLRQEFVANVSHELKTPLSSIKAYAETLSQGALEDPENRLHFVQQIEDQAERLHQLILDVLRLARIESGKQAFQIKAVPLSTVVHACLSDNHRSAQAKEITLEAEPSHDTVQVRADEEGVRQILDNLVDNAIKYTPEKGRVVVRWFVDDSMAVIEVQDTGIGIALKDQHRLFERFFRVDVARSRELGGTGLGLSIVKHLVQFFGGTVDVRSEPEVGSTFSVRLHLA